MITRMVSKQTQNNWLIDIALFFGAVVSSITGIYFLFLPVGGYQGGRNPLYGVIILFQRETWDDLHTWFGILMITAALVHIVVHWKWIVNMTKRIFLEITRKGGHLNARSRFNVGINMVIGASFLAAAISGIILLFTPGGRFAVIVPDVIFSRTIWDLIHAWAGILMIEAAVLHFAIHWGWIVKVTRKMIKSAAPTSTQKVPVKVVNDSQF